MTSMRRANALKLTWLNAYWVGLSFMWNSLHAMILPATLLDFVADERKNTALGLLTFSGLIIAMIVQPLSGAISDRHASRFGKRRPLILIGTVFDLLFLGMMALAGGIPGLAIAYVGLQFTSNVAHGPAQGLMHDQVPARQMGMASGIKNLFDMGGMVVSSLLLGRLLSPGSYGRSYLAVMFVLILAASATLLGVRERASTEKVGAPILGGHVREVFRIDMARHGAFARLILARLLFLAGIYGVQAFAQYFIRDTLATDNPIKLTGDLLATIVLSLIAFSMLSGYLCDRLGRKPLHAVAAALVALGCGLMLQAETAGAVLGYGSIIGAGIGAFISANWALANDLAPSGEAGRFLGLTNLATAGAGALSRLSGPGIDALNNLRPGANLGYAALFAGAGLLALLSLLALRGVPETAGRKAGALSPAA